MKDIINFRIGRANYILENVSGCRIKLVLDYGKSSFTSKILVEGKNSAKLMKQAGIIAKDMLSRKAQKNLSFKLLKLKI